MATTLSGTNTNLDNLTLSASTPDQMTALLNANEETIISNSKGMITSAEATTDGDTVMYTLSSSKMNKLVVNTLLKTNGDQLETLSDKVLDAMSEAGTENPKMTIKFVDDSGDVVKEVSYSK